MAGVNPVGGFDMGDDLMETLDLIDLGVVCISTFPLLKGTCEES